MKFVVALALLPACASALAKPIANGSKAGEYALRELFSQFEAKYERSYSSDDERNTKFLTFVSNLDAIIEKNEKLRALGKDEVHGITRFADMTQAEFAELMLDEGMAQLANTSIPVHAIQAKASNDPTSFDWRDEGVVTAVKNQLYCGSCWAFSATETVESQYALNGNTLTELSVQQTVSCDTTDSGCNGGWYYTAWMDYMEPNGGLTTETTYPYNTATSYGHATACDTTLEAETVSGTTPTSYEWATTPCTAVTCNSQDESTLKSNLLSYGPISIACDASEWSSYTGGVLTSSSCSSSAFKLDHAIQLVGYNTGASTPYWIVRNSWGEDWGEAGYIYLEMDTNTCGLADKPAMVYLES